MNKVLTVPTFIQLEQTFDFRKGVESDVRLRNFSPPEDGFVWSTGPWCEICIPAIKHPPDNEPLEIGLDIDVFKAPPEMEGQNVLIYANGLRVASRFVNSRVSVVAEVAGRSLVEGHTLITMDTPDAVSPSRFGGIDTRRLGVQLFSVTVRSM